MNIDKLYINWFQWVDGGKELYHQSEIYGKKENTTLKLPWVKNDVRYLKITGIYTCLSLSPFVLNARLTSALSSRKPMLIDKVE